MNKMILAAHRPSPLVCIWRSTGSYRMPLAGVWMQADTPQNCVQIPPTLRVTRPEHAYAPDGPRS